MPTAELRSRKMNCPQNDHLNACFYSNDECSACPARPVASPRAIQRHTVPPELLMSGSAMEQEPGTASGQQRNRPKGCGHIVATKLTKIPRKFARVRPLTEEELDQKRVTANVQERRRMQRLNTALDRLKRAIPSHLQVQYRRLSKIRTLRLAMDYIRFLHDTLYPAAAAAAPGIQNLTQSFAAMLDHRQRLNDVHPQMNGRTEELKPCRDRPRHYLGQDFSDNHVQHTAGFSSRSKNEAVPLEHFNMNDSSFQEVRSQMGHETLHQACASERYCAMSLESAYEPLFHYFP